MSRRSRQPEIENPTVPSPAGRRPGKPADDACQLCAIPQALTFHHLIPRRVHDRRWFRDRYSLPEMRSRGLWLCRGCHDFLHDHYDEPTLARRLDTLDRLRAEPAIARHIEWASRQRRLPAQAGA